MYRWYCERYSGLHFEQEENNNENNFGVRLNGDHSHFILVDSQSPNDEFRNRLENEIKNTYEVPIVSIAFAGGLDSLSAILNALKKNIPVIVLGVSRLRCVESTILIL